MEKEYIERGALLEELQEEIDFESAMYTKEQNKWFAIGLKCAYRDVKSQPIADVVSRAEARFKNAEITLLEDEIKRLGVENKQLKAEVERLADRSHKCIYLSDEESMEYCVDGPCPHYEAKAKVKAEAIKEFAERLQKSYYGLPRMSDEEGEYDYVCMESLGEFIDNLVAEMTEGK